MNNIKGTFTGRYRHYEYECEWEGHLIFEKGDRDTPDLYTAVVDKTEVTGCFDIDDEQLLCIWPDRVDEVAVTEAQEHADNGDYYDSF